MTLTQARQSAMNAEASLRAAQNEQVAAQQAERDAKLAVADAATAPLPGDGEQADTARNRVFELEAKVQQAKGRTARAGFALHRAQTAAREARERLDRLTPHAEALLKLAKAVAAVASKESAIVTLGQEMQARLAGEVGELRKLIEAAEADWAQLPADVRFLDMNPPASAALRFGNLAPTAKDLLFRLGLVVAANALVGAPSTPATPRPTRAPWQQPQA